MKTRVLTLSLGLVLWVSGGAFGQRVDIDQRIAYALTLAQKNDQSAVYSLCKENGPSILLHFQRYISDKNSDVRFAVETAAAQFSTPDSKAILLQLVRDNDTNVAEDALRTFMRLFPLKDLNISDSDTLNDGLVLRAKREEPSGLSLLLLAYHSQTPETIALLNRLREPKPGGPSKVEMINALPADRSTIADITLAQLNDKPASERIATIIHRGPVASNVDLISAIPYMTDSRLLLTATALLKDERITERVRGGMGFSGPGTAVPEVTYHRVCDLALIAFARRDPSVIPVDTSKGNQRPFTQRELNEGYNALHTYYSTLPTPKSL